MLSYIGLCFGWGLLKAHVLGAHSGAHALSGLGAVELLEELQFRTGLERLIAPRLSVAPQVAKLGQAVLFGLGHPGNEVDAALGGYVYSKAYDAHGLMGAVLSHVAHNVGVWAGSKS